MFLKHYQRNNLFVQNVNRAKRQNEETFGVQASFLLIEPDMLCILAFLFMVGSKTNVKYRLQMGVVSKH